MNDVIHKMKTAPTDRKMSDGTPISEAINESLCGEKVDVVLGSISGSGVTCSACAQIMNAEHAAPSR